MDQVVRKFQGPLDELESALGFYMIGFHFGWKVLYLIHTKATVAKYEKLLEINVREIFDEVGPDADRSLAFKAVQSFTNFWRVVSGDDKLPLSRDERRSSM